MHRDSNTHHLRVAKRSDETLRADFLPITGRLYEHHKTLTVVVASAVNLITLDRSVIEANVQHCRPVAPLRVAVHDSVSFQYDRSLAVAITKH